MIRRCLTLAALITAATVLTACGGDQKTTLEPGPGRLPSAVVLRLTNPNGSDAAIRLSIRGVPDLYTITDEQATVSVSESTRSQDGTIEYIGFGALASGSTLVRISFTNTTINPSQITARVLEVADANLAQRSSTSGYVVTAEAAPTN